MNIGYRFYCEELFVIKHKSQYRYESSIHFNLDLDIIKDNCNLLITLIIPTSNQQCLMVEMKLFWQFGSMTYILNVVSIKTFLSGFPASHIFCKTDLYCAIVKLKQKIISFGITSSMSRLRVQINYIFYHEFSFYQLL